jgi:hypothetical protein
MAGYRVVVGFVLGLLGSSAMAAPQWRCVLSGDLVQLVCDSLPPAAADDADATTIAVVNGTRFPLDRSRRWVVDLWSPPNELESVQLLARATICWRTPGCTVEVDAPYLAATARRR